MVDFNDISIFFTIVMALCSVNTYLRTKYCINNSWYFEKYHKGKFLLIKNIDSEIIFVQFMCLQIILSTLIMLITVFTNKYQIVVCIIIFAVSIYIYNCEIKKKVVQYNNNYHIPMELSGTYILMVVLEIIFCLSIQKNIIWGSICIFLEAVILYCANGCMEYKIKDEICYTKAFLGEYVIVRCVGGNIFDTRKDRFFLVVGEEETKILLEDGDVIRVGIVEKIEEINKEEPCL